LLNFAPQIADIFMHMDWVFCIADQKIAFITSDSPVLIIPPPGLDKVGLVIPGTRKFMSLSSNLCLEIGDMKRTPKVIFHQAKKDFCRSINRNTMAQAERFSFAADKGKLEKLMKDVKPYLIKKRSTIRLVD